jgi:thymidylate synthase (FAD)
MRAVEPEVFLVARTGDLELSQYLQSIGSPEWSADDNVSDAENLVEAAGRMCYRSWEPFNSNKKDATNPNVTRVRKGNAAYLEHILESGHGSCLEHASMTFVLKDVSRVVTHELVRHHAGCAYSQESLRYVRLTDIRAMVPDCFKTNPEALELFINTIEHLEYVQSRFAEIFKTDLAGTDFARKKELTSAFRRCAPLGLATSITFTGNVRALRHIIAMRTDLGAEAEIRTVFKKVAIICKNEYPNFFSDMTIQADGVCSFANEKV